MKTSKILLGALASAIITGSMLTSCSKEEALPPIGGYNSADEVASSNLVAYWGLNGDPKEAKSGSAPTKSQNVSYSTGIKGQAANFAAGYLAYDAIASLNSLPNATISLWANVKNNGTNPSVFFTLTRPNEWAGNVNLMAETGWRKAASDTLVLKGLVVTKVNGNDSWQDSRNEPTKGGVQAAKFGGTWTHIVMTWDGATSNFKIYANGVKVSNPEWELRGTTGTLNFTTPTKPIIGAWGTNISGTPDAWQVPLTGMIDEIRVWNKALSEGDISSLYQLETAGR
ncbi:LamG domain-containing protein [Runella sp. SP2]|uniref:LamG domain-containing protein n=1 Tax=Runella sp. SP2 TaxID=2268026 RepID=UPI000F0820CA|nr:LamG domain-containing protein [Runella sp. SP2]AYQ31996.1 LamG domain-containing protein [Runella sp. SP2]